MTSDDLDPQRAEERALARALRQVGEETANRQASASVEQALLAAFRARSEIREEPQLRTWLLRAAGVFLVLGASAWWITRPDVGSRDPRNRVTPSSPVRADGGGISSPQVRSSAADPGSGVGATAHEASATGNEVVTSFVPLPYGGGTTYLESAHVVRMDLPRSALVTLGVAVPEEQWTERMQADVLFGEDGLARGIRFVKAEK